MRNDVNCFAPMSYGTMPTPTMPHPCSTFCYMQNVRLRNLSDPECGLPQARSHGRVPPTEGASGREDVRLPAHWVVAPGSGPLWPTADLSPRSQPPPWLYTITGESSASCGVCRSRGWASWSPYSTSSVVTIRPVAPRTPELRTLCAATSSWASVRFGQFAAIDPGGVQVRRATERVEAREVPGPAGLFGERGRPYGSGGAQSAAFAVRDQVRRIEDAPEAVVSRAVADQIPRAGA